MKALSSAYRGYAVQDVVTAHQLAALLLVRTTDSEVEAERKALSGDRFDDVAVYGLQTRRIQVKSHTAQQRGLEAKDLKTTRLNFRIDQAIRSCLDDPEPAEEYRLSLTFGLPDESLAPYLRPAPHRTPSIPGASTHCFELIADRLWPTDAPPAWPVLGAVSRDEFVRFCDRFVIETNLPLPSGDLRAPGLLEDLLIRFLQERIGLGRAPNQYRDAIDGAAQLIYLAQTMRIQSGRRSADDVIAALDLRIDYGRVAEYLPLDEHHVVQRNEELDVLVAEITEHRRVVVTGVPGAGKSWLMRLLRARLAAEGWVCVIHYCFVNILDDARERRASMDALFGSLIAELVDFDHAFLTDEVARYAAGPRELEKMLAAAYRRDPTLRVAIIVDGLDHVDRVAAQGIPQAATDMTQELAALDLPPNVALVVGSQPGDHLDALLDSAVTHTVRRWTDEETQTLAEQLGVRRAITRAGLSDDIDQVLGSIAERARGNPLYATYLARTAITLAEGNVEPSPTADIAEYLSAAPLFDADINTYYRWLLDGVIDLGVSFITHLLALLDFPVTAEELTEIHQGFGHLVRPVLARLAPILDEDPGRGGLRIYHESFQRFVQASMAEEFGADRAAVLAPAITWLEGRGFFTDERAFRALLPMLQSAGRDSEIIDRVDRDFVIDAAAHGHSGDAVMANLRVAASSAATTQSWPALARLVELARSADHLYYWRLDVDETLAEAYGRAYSAIFGASALAARLVHDGRCTFRPRPGLILCGLCEEHGVAAPWAQYRGAHDVQRLIDNTSYGPGDRAIDHARLIGRLRLEGPVVSPALVTHWLKEAEELPLHAYDVASVFGRMFGIKALGRVIDDLEPGTAQSWAHIAAAEMAEDQEASLAHAQAAMRIDSPLEVVRACVRLGVDTSDRLIAPQALDALTEQVCTRAVRLNDDLLSSWLTQVDLAAALADETTLFRIETLIPTDSWYHRWLRFAVAMGRIQNADGLVRELTSLSTNIEVFQGDPRVVDLYPVHEEIRDSFRQVLLRLDDAQWTEAIDILAVIGSETNSSLQGTRSGPLPMNAFFDLCLQTADTDAKRTKASTLAAELLTPARATNEDYDTHAQDELLLVRLHINAGKRELAEQAWQKACLYLSAYGMRKDITVREVLDCLPALGAADSARVRELLAKVQPIVEGILVHTDGAETRHAIHEWIDIVARFHPAGALTFLAQDAVRRTPLFGAMYHAFPVALAHLEGVLPDTLLAAGWVAAGSEARDDPEHAIGACERAVAINPQLSSAAWSVVVAVLDGDGVGSVADAERLVRDSATRLNRFRPSLRARADKDDSDSPPYKRVWQRRHLGPEPAFCLPQDARPLQIAHAVRQWRAEIDQPVPVDAVINAVGWRILEFDAAGKGDDAETLIRRIAADTASWQLDELLHGLAEGLKRHGAVRLAALAFVFAYTRSRDGWRRFAGEKGQEAFRQALRLDSSIAWTTLAEEVADSAAHGGELGVNVHLIELLVEGGLIDEAYATWTQACEVILLRVPSTGEADQIEVRYSSNERDPEPALLCAMAARVNHILVDERRAALAGLSLAVSLGGEAFSHVLALAMPTSVTMALLNLALECEPTPFQASRAAEPALRVLCAADAASVRTLAHLLLERAGVSAPVAPPVSLSMAPSISDERARLLVEGFGSARIEPVEEVWPGFARLWAERFDIALKSPEMKHRMRPALSRLRVRPGRQVRVWLPTEEEAVRLLQAVAATARTAFASRGVIDPDIEREVGLRLLQDFDLGVRRSLSRIPRPSYYIKPSEAPELLVAPGAQLVPHGDFATWIIVAHHERELIVGHGYDTPIQSHVESWSSLTFAEEQDIDLQGKLPLGYGSAEVWVMPSVPHPSPLAGPAGGYDIRPDSYGTVDVLTPNEILIMASELVPGSFEQGLTLIDSQGNAALLCRAWREELLGDEQLADHQHRLVGLELLARPDIMEAAAGWAVAGPVHVTAATERQTSDD